MSRGRELAAIALVLAACAPTSVTPASSPTATLGASQTSAPTPTSPQTVAPTPRGYALVCGTISRFVGDSAQADGVIVLEAPGRDSLRLTIPAGRLGSGGASGYVCVQVQRGNPSPLFDGFVPGGVSIFIQEGTIPATAASPAPTGFMLPQACAFVATPSVSPAQIDWLIECGPSKDRDTRGALAPELTRQGWTLCGSGLAVAQWRKGNTALLVSESSLAPGDYPRLTQPAVTPTSC
jgi:hypothetical protein